MNSVKLFFNKLRASKLIKTESKSENGGAANTESHKKKAEDMVL